MMRYRRSYRHQHKSRFVEMFGNPVSNDRMWCSKILPDVLKDDTRIVAKLQTSGYLDSGSCPIVDQGKKLIAGYTNTSEGIYEDVPAIVFGDHTCIWKYIQMPFCLGADGAKVLNAKGADVDLRYIYEALRFYSIPDSGYSRHFKWVREFCLPLPPLALQREFAAFVEKVDKLAFAVRESLESAEKLYRQQLSEAFA